MSKLKAAVIKYSKKLNITNLSVLRSGNISVRAKKKGVEGFYITPSGRKYSSLKLNDIVFVSLKGIYDKKKGKPSSEWRFHQDIYVNKKEAKAIVHAHSTCATAVSTHQKSIPAFHNIKFLLTRSAIYIIVKPNTASIKCVSYSSFVFNFISQNF